MVARAKGPAYTKGQRLGKVFRNLLERYPGGDTGRSDGKTD